MATTEAATDQAPADVVEARPSIVVDPPQQQAEQVADAAPNYVKTIDKMGNELGELRKQNRELQQLIQKMNAPQAESPTPVSFDSDPAAFVAQAVGQAIDERLGPQLQVLESDLHERRGAEFDRKVSEQYPDWKETAQSDDFVAWVKASQGRSQMYMIADKHFDSDSAVELLKRFKADQAEADESKTGAINAAGMVDGGGSADGVKVYAASEVKHMMETDPEAYRRWLAGDGMNAYRDGRVDQNR